MRRIPFMILLCLFVSSIDSAANPAHSPFIDVIIKPVHSITVSSGRAPDEDLRSPLRTRASNAPTFRQASWGSPAERGPLGFVKPITKCKPPAATCAPPSCAEPCLTCILPIRMPGQFEAEAQAFYARIQGTVQWTNWLLAPFSSEVDFTGDLGIPGHQTLGEYIGRYQLRPQWALHYSVITTEMGDSYTPSRSFNFGSWTYAAGIQIRPKWQFFYQRVGLLYQPIVTPYAIVSLFGGWAYNDQSISVASGVCSNTCNTVDRTRNMVMTGIEVQKCIITLPTSGTLSCDTRVNIGFLDDTTALDVQTGLQFSVPMNAGRWGYAKSGYRLINMKEDRDALRLDTSMEGGFVELGLIF